LLCYQGLIKASRIDVSITPRSITRVYGDNFTETYRFIKSFLEQGFVEKTTQGFKLTERSLKLVDFTITLLPSPEP
jgi:DNA-binding IclR family transcriptional regulator